MLVIEYKYCVEDVVYPALMTWSEANEEVAKKIACDGKPLVRESVPEDFPEDDFPLSEQPSDKERIAELEEALELLLSGVTE